MKRLENYPLAELKLVYRTLHANLMQNSELIDSQLLYDLQTHLQGEAAAAGVAIADHAAWDAWLGNSATPCGARLPGRQRID